MIFSLALKCGEVGRDFLILSVFFAQSQWCFHNRFSFQQRLFAHSLQHKLKQILLLHMHVRIFPSEKIK